MPLLYGMTWQEVVGSLPSVDRAELVALLTPAAGEDDREDEQAEDTT